MIDKKEIKRQYKQASQPMGVYRITNLANGKIYVGSSRNMRGTFNSIRFQLKLGSHMNKELQKDYALFGEEKFSFEAVDHLEPKKEIDYDCTKDLKVLEEMWLEKLQPYDEKGYNKRKSLH